MSIRLQSGSNTHIDIDLGTGHQIDPTTTALTIAGWFKVSSYTDYDPFMGFQTNASAQGTSRAGIECYNNGSGGTRNFEAAIDGSGLGFSTPTIPTGTWKYIAFTRPSGSSVSTAAFYCGDNTDMTTGSHTGLAMSTTAPFRYITLGMLGDWSIGVSTFNGEVAQLRVWTSVLTASDLQTEAASATPVITSGLVVSLPMDTSSDHTDQSGNSIAWALHAGGSMTDGATNPPSGAAASGGTLSVTSANISFTGQNVTLDAPIAVANGSIALAGQDVQLTLSSTLTVLVDSNNLTLSGQDVQLLANNSFTLPVTNGVLTLEGQEVPFQLTVPWTEGTLTFTGQDVTLTAGVSFTLPVSSTALTLTGQDVAGILDVDYTLTVTEANLSLTGQDVTFSVQGNIVLPVTEASLTLLGQDVGISPSFTLSGSASARPRRKRSRGPRTNINIGR